MRKELKRIVCGIYFSLRGLQDEPPLSARCHASVGKHPPSGHKHKFVLPRHRSGNGESGGFQEQAQGKNANDGGMDQVG